MKTQRRMTKAMMSRKVIVYIAASLDGYIAKPDDDLSFLSAVQKEGEDYGYKNFVESVDTVIMGRKTFDWVFKEISALPHPDKKTYIITRQERPSIGTTEFYTGNMGDLVRQLIVENGKNIFVDGGAEVVNELLRNDLIDEFIISIVPIFVGSGTKLFRDGRPEQQLELVSAQTFDTGLTQLHYRRKRQ